jgi:hypothetical protein
MKRSTVASFCFFFLFAALSLRGQVVPAASSGSLAIDAGGLGSVSQPDYAGEGIAQTSPNRLYGAGTYVDVHFNRWVDIEGEARWLTFNQYLGINEKTYLLGGRVPVGTFKGRFTPYGKVLVGIGDGSFLNGHSFVLAYGGGLDIRLSHRLTLRAPDFEYQQWQVTPTIWPYVGSLGITYRVFGPH